MVEAEAAAAAAMEDSRNSEDGSAVCLREAKKEMDDEDEKFLEGMAVLDFDMLCATVALQTRGLGKVENRCKGELVTAEAGVQRMWEGNVLDCLEDRRIAIDSVCCHCVVFGKNMRRAGLGSCWIQGSTCVLLTAIAILCYIGLCITGRRYFLYLALVFTISIAVYKGYFRLQIRKRFNLSGGESPLDDCLNHLLCPCCALCQESRTLEMNNVRDGLWHGRGEMICIGNTRGSIEPHFELGKSPALPLLSTKSPEVCSMQRPEECNGSELKPPGVRDLPETLV